MTKTTKEITFHSKKESVYHSMIDNYFQYVYIHPFPPDEKEKKTKYSTKLPKHDNILSLALSLILTYKPLMCFHLRLFFFILISRITNIKLPSITRILLTFC